MTPRGKRMFDELDHTSELQAEMLHQNPVIGPMARTRMAFLAGVHLGVRFVLDHPELAAELVETIEETLNSPGVDAEASAKAVNLYLVRAAHGDA